MSSRNYKVIIADHDLAWKTCLLKAMYSKSVDQAIGFFELLDMSKDKLDDSEVPDLISELPGLILSKLMESIDNIALLNKYKSDFEIVIYAKIDNLRHDHNYVNHIGDYLIFRKINNMIMIVIKNYVHDNNTNNIIDVGIMYMELQIKINIIQSRIN